MLSKTAAIGLGAMIVSALLGMGGLSFLAVSTLIRDLPPLIFIAPVAQILLSLVGFAAGFLLMRGHAAAGYVLVFVGICIFINFVFYTFMLALMAVKSTQVSEVSFRNSGWEQSPRDSDSRAWCFAYWDCPGSTGSAGRQT